MTKLLLTLSMTGLTNYAPLALSQSQPCVWPNRCARETVQLAPETCVWPNRC